LNEEQAGHRLACAEALRGDRQRGGDQQDRDVDERHADRQCDAEELVRTPGAEHQHQQMRNTRDQRDSVATKASLEQRLQKGDLRKKCRANLDDREIDNASYENRRHIADGQVRHGQRDRDATNETAHPPRVRDERGASHASHWQPCQTCHQIGEVRLPEMVVHHARDVGRASK